MRTPDGHAGGAASRTVSHLPGQVVRRGADNGSECPERGCYDLRGLDGILTGDKHELCSPQKAAERLGISVEEVIRLIGTGELAAVRFMGDEQWFVESDAVKVMARRFAKQGADPDGKVGGRTRLLRLLGRLQDAIF